MPPAKDFVILTRLNAQLTEDPTGVKTHHEQDSSKSVWQRTLKPIGSGGMGEVYREQCITGENAGALRAVKAIQKPNPRIASKINLDYSRELEALARFSQPQYQRCFVRSYGWYETIDTVFIAMEYVEHGDLQQYVGAPMPENQVQQIAAQVLEGLAFLHSSGYAHRDLKPGNLLVSSTGPQWHVKIGDFGLSKRVIEGLTSLRTQGGTFGYMAPEQIGLGDDDDDSDDESKPSYTNAVDIWALGVVSFVMLTGDLPFQGSPWKSLKKYIQRKDPFPSDALVARDVSAEGCAWIQSCMAPKPGDRPSAGFSVRHRWLIVSATVESTEQLLHITSFSETMASANWTTQASVPQTVVPATPDTTVPAKAASPSHSTALKVLIGHTARVYDVVFSPDGRLVATAAYEHTARLWNTGSGLEVKRLDHSSIVNGVAFSPDGRLVATASGDGIRVWDVASGKDTGRSYRDRKLSNTVVSVAFSPDGQLMVSTSMSGELDSAFTLWDTVSGKKAKTLGTPRCISPSVTFSPDGRLVATGGSIYDSLRFYSVQSGTEVKCFPGHAARVLDVAFSPDGQLVATASGDGTVRLWQVSSSSWEAGNTARMLNAQEYDMRKVAFPMFKVAFSPNGQLIASVSPEGLVVIWEVQSGEEVKRLPGDAMCVAFSRDGSLLAIGGLKRTVQVWDLEKVLSLTDSQRRELIRRAEKE